MLVACPYCGVVLEKLPARKTKCKECGRLMYRGSTPEDRIKRLMTEEQWSEAGRLWSARSARRSSECILTSIGVPADYLDKVIASTGWTRDVAIEACLMAVAADGTRTRHERKMACLGVAPGLSAAGDVRWRQYAEQARREELTDMLERSAGIVVGVTIAKSVGGLGPQCNRHTGRVFSVQDALTEMPLPCDEKCSCWWRPVLRSDRSTVGPQST